MLDISGSMVNVADILDLCKICKLRGFSNLRDATEQKLRDSAVFRVAVHRSGRSRDPSHKLSQPLTQQAKTVSDEVQGGKTGA
jgi:hypothetical protein